MLPDATGFSSGYPQSTSPHTFSEAVLNGTEKFGIWMCDLDGEMRDANLALGRLIKDAKEFKQAQQKKGETESQSAPLSKAAVSDAGWVPTLNHSEPLATLEKWRKCLDNGDCWEHEYKVPTQDGHIRHVLSRGLPVKNEAGQTLAWIGVNFEISGLKEAEEELRQSQERFRVALESGCDLLYECELAAGTRRWFGPVDEILGYAGCGFPRTDPAWEMALHPEDRETVLESRRRHLAGQAPFQLEYRVLKRNGEILHWMDRGKVMRDKEGLPRLWIGFVTDITDRRRAEELLRKSEERRRMSQRLEVIGRLAGGIAHDFNNLLTAVNGYSELVLAQLADDSELAPHMREILRAGERAANLTRQLLAFSRRQILSPKVLDLNQVVIGMRKILGEFMGPAIEIHIQPSDQLATIKADPEQVEQVILNLALNAKDAMSQGGSLQIETESQQMRAGDFPVDPLDGEPKPGEYVILSVRDSGIGMDEDTKAHLFEPFYSTKGRSHGLGLSAVYGIVKQSGGHIAVTSQKGEGTTLKLYWPRFERGTDTTELEGLALAVAGLAEESVRVGP